VIAWSPGTPLWHVMLLGFPLLTIALFAWLPPRRAALWCTLIVALFLPEGGYAIQGLPNYSKYSALSAVLLAAIVLDRGRPLQIRPSWIDLPILVWCFVRLATSISNGLGIYDGLSASLRIIVTFGLPYWVGRTYFTDSAGMRELARGIVIGGLLYLPLCLFELRFSPQLHAKLYGFMTVPFYMIMRYGSYRPIIFMDSSLQVAMWMSAATVVCWWIAYSGAIKRIAGIPTKWIALALFIVTVLTKARGALALSIVGIGLFFVLRAWRNALPLAVALGVVASYPALRGSGLIEGPEIESVAGVLFDEERVRSLATRLRSEDMYIEHSGPRPLLGWGDYGRGDVEVDGVRSIPDGLWVIALSRSGWISVVSLLALYLLPVLLLVRRISARRWTTAEFAPIAVLPVLMMLYWVDCLSNAMVTPVLVVAMGAAAGWFAQPRARTAEAAPATAAPKKNHAEEAKPAANPAPSLARALIERRRARRASPPAP